MPKEETYVPETSRISELKRLVLIGALAGIGVGLLRRGLTLQSHELTARDAHFMLTVFIEMGLACLLGSAIVFYAIRKIRWWVVEATWWCMLLVMYFTLGTILEWNGIRLIPF